MEVSGHVSINIQCLTSLAGLESGFLPVPLQRFFSGSIFHILPSSLIHAKICNIGPSIHQLMYPMDTSPLWKQTRNLHHVLRSSRTLDFPIKIAVIVVFVIQNFTIRVQFMNKLRKYNEKKKHLQSNKVTCYNSKVVLSFLYKTS